LQTQQVIPVLTTANQLTTQLAQSSLFPAPFYFLKISFNELILTMSSYSKCLLSLRSLHKILYVPLFHHTLRTDGHTVRHDYANSHCPEFCNTPKYPVKDDQASRLYMDLYSAAWSVCAETDSIQL